MLTALRLYDIFVFKQSIVFALSVAKKYCRSMFPILFQKRRCLTVSPLLMSCLSESMPIFKWSST